MKKIVRLTESDLVRLVRRVINEQGTPQYIPEDAKKSIIECGGMDGLTLILKFPKCAKTALEIISGNIDLFQIPSKISDCLEELEGVNSSDIQKISKILTCLGKSLSPFKF
jgi:hypothetical protein